MLGRDAERQQLAGREPDSALEAHGQVRAVAAEVAVNHGVGAQLLDHLGGEMGEAVAVPGQLQVFGPDAEGDRAAGDPRAQLRGQDQAVVAGERFNMQVETRQFAPACIMVAEGVGAAVVSPIDAAEYAGRGLAVRPFEPAIAFGLGILYPAYRPRSLILAEFVELFQASLEPFRMDAPETAAETAA